MPLNANIGLASHPAVRRLSFARHFAYNLATVGRDCLNPAAGRRGIPRKGARSRHDSATRDPRERRGACGGKLLGDGVLAVFTSARQAIEGALACGRAGADAGLPLHLGLHAGDVIREENNVYGGAVNIAARISALASPGEVLVSSTVRSLARTSAAETFEDKGDRGLRGVSEPVRVWAVREAP